MGVVVPVGEGQVTLMWACTGLTRPISCSFGVAGGPGGLITPSLLADASYTAATSISGGSGPCVAGAMHPQWQFLGTEGMLMTAPGPLTAQKLLTVTGSLSTQPIPVNCAFLLNKVTGLGGRKNKGRCYVPPISIDEANVDARGTVTPGSLVSILGAWNLFKSRLNALDYDLVLHHSDGTSGTEITSLAFSPIIGTQRRRMR